MNSKPKLLNPIQYTSTVTIDPDVLNQRIFGTSVLIDAIVWELRNALAALSHKGEMTELTITFHATMKEPQ